MTECMAAAYGLNGNVGHDMNNEDTYRELVRITAEHQEHFANYVMKHSIEEHKKRLIWLLLVGLIDTWYYT